MNTANSIQSVAKNNTFTLDAKIFKITATGAVTWLIAISLLLIAIVEIKYKFRHKIKSRVSHYREKRKSRKNNKI